MTPRKPGRYFRLKMAAWLIALIALCAAGYLRELALREEFCFEGVPLSDRFCRILRNKGYISCYSDLLGEPVWVAYKLSPVKNAREMPRPNFSADIRAFSLVSPEDYVNSGYDRGHLAPNYAISRLYGETAQKETFLMTNIAPQKGGLNRGVWKRLEAAAIDVFAPEFGEVWVVKGCVYDREVARIGWKVAVPSAFFAVYAARVDGLPKVLAFIAPQEPGENAKPSDLLASVDRVEEMAKIDLFHRLEDSIESAIEGAIDPDGWNMP